MDVVCFQVVFQVERGINWPGWDKVQPDFEVLRESLNISKKAP
jgi:hypothetical protein